MRSTRSLEAQEGEEVPDLKNGATETTKETERKIYFVFFVTSVVSVAPFLRSGTFVTSLSSPQQISLRVRDDYSILHDQLDAAKR